MCGYVRRKKRKGLGGEVSVPCEQTESWLRQKLKEEIKDGVIKVGKLVNPRLLEKYVMKDGVFEKTSFVVEGRKIPLLEIRKDILKQQRKIYAC